MRRSPWAWPAPWVWSLDLVERLLLWGIPRLLDLMEWVQVHNGGRWVLPPADKSPPG